MSEKERKKERKKDLTCEKEVTKKTDDCKT